MIMWWIELHAVITLPPFKAFTHTLSKHLFHIFEIHTVLGRTARGGGGTVLTFIPSLLKHYIFREWSFRGFGLTIKMWVRYFSGKENMDRIYKSKEVLQTQKQKRERLEAQNELNRSEASHTALLTNATRLLDLPPCWILSPYLISMCIPWITCQTLQSFNIFLRYGTKWNSGIMVT